MIVTSSFPWDGAPPLLYPSNANNNKLLPQFMCAAIDDGSVTLTNRKTVTLDHVFASRQQWLNTPPPSLPPMDKFPGRNSKSRSS